MGEGGKGDARVGRIADLALSAHATKLQRVVTVEKAQGPDVTKASSASSAAERIRTKQYLKSYSEKQLRRACQALDQKMMHHLCDVFPRRR